MAIICLDAANSFWEPLKPREDEACFLCGGPLVTAPVIAQEGSAGQINGVGQYAKRAHVLYLHARCAERLAEALNLDARAVQHIRPNAPGGA